MACRDATVVALHNLAGTEATAALHLKGMPGAALTDVLDPAAQPVMVDKEGQLAVRCRRTAAGCASAERRPAGPAAPAATFRTGLPRSAMPAVRHRDGAAESRP